MEEKVSGIEKRVDKLEEHVENLQNEDKDLRNAIHNLRESIVELSTLLKGVLSVGKWGFAIIGSIAAGVGIAVVIAVAQLLK